MAGEWRRCTIGDLCDARIAELQTGPFGSQLHAHDYVDEGVAIVPTEAIRNRRIDHSVLPKISPTKAQQLVRHRLQPGDILFARRGVQATGHVGYIREAEDGFICGTGAIRLRVNEHGNAISTDFISHVLADPASIDWFKFHAIGATMPNLNEGIIRSFPFALPPLAEQRAIAHILGTLDDKIELNRRINETLEAIARALFKSWFVDFLPVRAKMAAANQAPYVSTLPAAEKGKWFVYAMECDDGSVYIGQAEDLRQRWRQHSSGKGGRWTKGHPPVRVVHWEVLPSRQEAVEREKWLKTGYGRKWLKRQIAAASARTQTGDPVRAKAKGRDLGLPKPLADLFPNSFEDSELGEIPAGWKVGTVDDEFNLAMGQSPPGDTYNDTGDGLPFYQGRSDFGFRFPTQRVFCTAPTRYADANDTLISVRAPVGDINMAAERCCIGRGVAAARHKSSSRSYTYYFMQSIKEVFDRFEAEGTVFGSINKKDFHNIQRVMPPKELIDAFERLAAPIDERIAGNERESRTLAALRDTLLPKLISGELQVKDVEKLAEEAV